MQLKKLQNMDKNGCCVQHGDIKMWNSEHNRKCRREYILLWFVKRGDKQKSQ